MASRNQDSECAEEVSERLQCCQVLRALQRRRRYGVHEVGISVYSDVGREQEGLSKYVTHSFVPYPGKAAERAVITEARVTHQHELQVQIAQALRAAIRGTRIDALVFNPHNNKFFFKQLYTAGLAY